MNKDLDEARAMMITTIAIIVSIILFLGVLLLTSSCTLNVIMTHTEGSATDVVDSNPSTKADVTPTVSVPVIP